MALLLPPWLDEVGLQGLPVRGSLVLGGSISLGESHVSGEFGDADMYFFGDGDEYAEVAARAHHEPRVHISHVPWESIGGLPRTYRLFELGAAGRVMSGRPIELPRMVAQELDKGDLNDIVAWRALSVARALALEPGDRTRYLAAKNWLDVGIWLAGQQELLLAGSAARIEGLRAARPVNQTIARLIGRWLERADEAFATKRGSVPFQKATGPELAESADLLAACLGAILRHEAPHPQMSDARLRRRLGIVRNQLRARRMPTGIVGGQHRRVLEFAEAGLAQRRVSPAWVAHHDMVFGGSEE